MIELFSQAQPSIGDIQGWMQVCSSLGFGGLAWYLISFAMPKMQERFDSLVEKLSAESKKTHDALVVEIKEGRIEFSRQMELQRDSCKQEMIELSTTYEKHIDRLLSSK